MVEVRFDVAWTQVCALARLIPGRGRAALLPDGRQIAVFLDRTGRVYAIGNRDPFTGAQVLARGLLGSAQGRPFVASPLLKQRFDLTDGHCLDEPGTRVPTHPARVRRPQPPETQGPQGPQEPPATL
ncbi:nitrite reductase small subunit NirD [Streptomyces sp. XM4193]|uniref:nitrite reductase small subunit NirD n=1 Tax=Streptomyces sp. XM4193 TaxID=2929782 RepID=UPI0035AC109E